jgi:hypothetical protein
MKIQTGLVYSIGTVSALIFALYLGFMTQYYVLFYDGTDELYEFYKQLQVFNKDAFVIALRIMVLTLILMTFELHKYRPGLLGVIFALGMTIYISLSSFPLLNDLPKYRRDYLAYDFTSMDEYTPSTLAFDFGLIFHYAQVGLLIVLCVVVVITFVQRVKEGNPIVRKFI